MLPLKDNIPTARFPIVTVAFIAINVIAFIWQLNFPTDNRLDQAGFGAIDQSALEYGAIPDRVLTVYTHAQNEKVFGTERAPRHITGVLLKGDPTEDIALPAPSDWVARELEHFSEFFTANTASPSR